MFQRVEKELQEKAQVQGAGPGKREAGDGGEEVAPPQLPPFTFQLPAEPGLAQHGLGQAQQPPEPAVIQSLANLSITSGRSLANIPPSERPKESSFNIGGQG